MTTAQQLIDAIRQVADTTRMSADDFAELAQAACFYGRTMPARDAARLALEEVFTESDLQALKV